MIKNAFRGDEKFMEAKVCRTDDIGTHLSHMQALLDQLTLIESSLGNLCMCGSLLSSLDDWSSIIGIIADEDSNTLDVVNFSEAPSLLVGSLIFIHSQILIMHEGVRVLGHASRCSTE